MSLVEIEAAVEKLAPAEQSALFEFLAARLREAGNDGLKLRSELLAKWQARQTDVVEQAGGTQSYLNAVRGRDEDCG